ncbi:helix-turn-helix domain-containing protein [Pseudoalteromonas sp. T1lg23B]|uniref:2TM domain-containing protein n=1 Tax=Pseudoalteromonas sp. T1lg23B TaxID=2077097 RepID=UPI000CF5F4AB
MIIRKLRLQKGWSQEQLAQLSGLSLRTIQRIERGQTPSLESLRSLAAVFETTVASLQQELTMKTDTNTAAISDQENKVIEQVWAIKAFYSHLIQYGVTIITLFIVNYFVSPHYYWAWWVALGWGVGVISHALDTYEVFNLFGAKWEKRQIEKRLGRKL